jgi:hypothetical protein
MSITRTIEISGLTPRELAEEFASWGGSWQADGGERMTLWARAWLVYASRYGSGVDRPHRPGGRFDSASDPAVTTA